MCRRKAAQTSKHLDVMIVILNLALVFRLEANSFSLFLSLSRRKQKTENKSSSANLTKMIYLFYTSANSPLSLKHLHQPSEPERKRSKSFKTFIRCDLVRVNQSFHFARGSSLSKKCSREYSGQNKAATCVTVQKIFAKF